MITKRIVPNKLQSGDEIRIIAPACSLKIVTQANIDYAIHRLESLDLKVSFGKHVNEKNILDSSSIASRLEDLHDAFQEKNVKAILTVIGGSNSNQLLEHIDYHLIKKNPKILCGFSDITALQNAILSKTGLITYSGPQFSSFAMKQGFEYTLDYFKKMFFERKTVEIHPSDSWSDDPWYEDQEKRIFHKNQGYWLIHPGNAKGTIIGGNVSTLVLLHGTEYIPAAENIILFIESDNITEKHGVPEFDRAFQSMIHQPYFKNVKAIIIGRFEEKFGMSLEKLKFIIESRSELKNLPIIANVDFGHTMPMFTFPIGGECKIAAENSLSIRIFLNDMR